MKKKKSGHAKKKTNGDTTVSELLSQNISLIYDMIRDSVKLYRNGESYAALQGLGFAGALMYFEPKNHGELDEIDKTLQDIEEEVSRISSVSHEDTNAQQYQEANTLSSPHFYKLLKNLRKYMQRVGYYQMMNKKWTDFYDLSDGRKSE